MGEYSKTKKLPTVVVFCVTKFGGDAGIGHNFPPAGGSRDPVSLAFARSDLRFPPKITNAHKKTTNLGSLFVACGDAGNRTRVRMSNSRPSTSVDYLNI